MDKYNNNRTVKDCKVKHRANYLANNLLLSDLVYEILNNSKGLVLPTAKVLAEKSGLSVKTVQRHFKTLHFEPIASPLRSLSDRVIVNMFNLTRKSAAAQKLWFEIMEGWSEDSTVNLNTTGSNPIPMSPETIALGDKYLDALMKEADDNRASKT
jgi:hypothetical protein